MKQNKYTYLYVLQGDYSYGHGFEDLIKLTFNEITNPDFDGFKFYVEEGTLFDIADYSAAYHLNPFDIDPQDVHAVQDAASRLTDGQWLEVSHTN